MNRLWAEGVCLRSTRRHLALGLAVLFFTAPGCAASSSTDSMGEPWAAMGEVVASVPTDVAAPPSHAWRTDSGLASMVLRPGTQMIKPGPRSVVAVHYTGWTTDGEVFDSTAHRGAAATFSLEHVIPGWAEGLQLMNVGEVRRLWIPENLAYRGRPGTPAGMLVFDVELISVR